MKEWIENRWGYLRFIDNWHKHPIISKLMCKLGRHDYEAQKVLGNTVVLYCFYCGHLRGSHVPEGHCNCCERANEYNGYGSDGPTTFTCPKNCPCHDRGN